MSVKYCDSGNGRPFLDRSAGEMSVKSLFHAAGSIFDWTYCGSMPGYQLNCLTMPSACTSGLAAIQHVKGAGVARRHHDVLVEVLQPYQRFFDRRLGVRVVRPLFELVADA